MGITPFQRIFFAMISYLIPKEKIKELAVILSSETIFKLHRMFKNKKYRTLFSSNTTSKKPGPKGPSKEVIDAIIEMKKRNPRMGCPKIALTISNIFGINIDKDMVRRVLSKYYRPGPFNHGGSSWLTLIGNLKDSLWSLDLFRVESIHLKTHWVMLVMDQYTRRIIGFSALQTNALTGANICMTFNKIIGENPYPKWRVKGPITRPNPHSHRACAINALGGRQLRSLRYTPFRTSYGELLSWAADRLLETC